MANVSNSRFIRVSSSIPIRKSEDRNFRVGTGGYIQAFEHNNDCEEAYDFNHSIYLIFISTTIVNYLQYLKEMRKEEDIFEQDDDHNRVSRNQNRNLFLLPDEIRNNINKRLPRGFCLMKANEFPQNQKFQGQIQYVPEKRQIRVASQQLAKQFVIQTQLPNTGRRQSRVEDKGLRFGQLPEGKSKHGEKIKMIIQRFRKHQRYTTFLQHLTRLGFAGALNQIQNENRKNIHTIQSFKQRTLFLFQKALEVTYEPDKVAFINQMIDQIQFLVQNAQKTQFTSSLGFIQKSIDKVTRQISDIRETGSYYYRRKKRNQKSYDEKQIIYIAELIRTLPTYEMVGIIEIIEEKPFVEIAAPNYTFDLNSLKHKKIREIEFYVRKKLSCFYRSRERKQMKMEMKEKQYKDKQGQSNSLSGKNDKSEIRKENDLDFVFEDHENRTSRRKMEQGQPQMLSVDPFSIVSHSHFDPHHYEQHDDLFGDHEASRRSSPISVVREQSHVVDFQPLEVPLAKSQVKEAGEEKSQNEPTPIEQLDSDSSYITDEEDSDF